jgi:hypothetical protein
MAATTKEQTTALAKLLEKSNEVAKKAGSTETFGKCEWTDVDGNQRCNSPWSAFQCQQVAGMFTPDGSC